MTERRTVNEAFGLSYASYFVVPRLILEAMPPEWQDQFCGLVEQAHELYVFDQQPYEVRLRDASGRWVHDPLSDYRRGVAPPREESA